ncbi:InlB B-repeat-containing protein [Streptomyces sp. NBC_01497]|uniref:InlB B-repeat-containing protein n=1 Tax=Streptomyces sp. NBC_01497 TaxID=2903885 RepID=UPI002E2F2D49|nr:M12 family metallo-peptidase [Streptomyces sp. NBC_01497]
MRRRFPLTASCAATALTVTLSLALTAPAASAGGKHEPWVMRSATMSTDAKAFRSLCGKQKEGKPQRLTFPLFKHGKPFTAVQDFQRRNADGSVYWGGHDPKNSENTISVTVIGACTNGPVTLSGAIQVGFHQYMYEPLAKKHAGQYVLQEIDSLKLPPSGRGVDTVDVPAKKPHKPHKPQKPGQRAATPDNPAAIDIVAAYTPATVNELGSVSAVLSRIGYGVNQLNRALANSNVPASVHVVNTYQTAATGVPRENVNTLLGMINNPTNTVLGVTANAQRQRYGADLVALLASVPVEDSSGASDLPSSGPSATTDRNAFSVTSIYSVTGWENLAHEIGHNFGMQHDRLTVSRQGGTPPAGSFNYGWVTPNGQHRTLMAYSTACPQPCNVVNAYSNTERVWGDQPLGNAMNNNAAVARQNADILAAYRPSTVTNRSSLTLFTTPAAGGTVRVSEYGPYDPGTRVTVTAFPNPGYRFDAWAVDGVELDVTAPSYELTMNGNRTINALFAPIEP